MRLPKVLILCLGMLAAALSPALAQTGTEPEFKNKVQLLKEDNTLSDLDNTDLKSMMKNNMTGGYKINITAEGKSAAVKMPGKTTTKYMVKIEAGTDPESVVELFLCDVDKKNRIITVVSAKMGVQQNITLPKQKLAFTKVKDGVYSITCKEQLEPGEYVFIVGRPPVDPMGGTMNVKGFAFTVE